MNQCPLFLSVIVSHQIPVHKWNTLFIQYIHKWHVPVCLVWSWTSGSSFRPALSRSDSKHRLVQWRAYTFSRSNNWYAIYMLMYGNEMLFAHAIVSLWKQGEAVKPFKRERLQCVKNMSVHESEWYVLFMTKTLLLVSGVMVRLLEWSSFPEHNVRFIWVCHPLL